MEKKSKHILIGVTVVTALIVIFFFLNKNKKSKIKKNGENNTSNKSDFIQPISLPVSDIRSADKIILQDGIYNSATIEGYRVTVYRSGLSKYEFKTNRGVKSPFPIPAIVTVKNGIAFVKPDTKNV